MTPLESLGFALGTAFASGLNLYATAATLGLLHRFDVIELPAGLAVLASPLVLGVAVTLYVIEFVADKVPYVDNVWDMVHTFIRPPAAALLAWSALGAVDESWRIAAALLAGSVALTSHGTKASARAGVNTSPEPFSNWILSLGEDGIAITLAWMAITYPVLTLVVVLLLVIICAWLLVKLFGFLRKMLRRVLQREAASAGPAPGSNP
jgi:hypothetical protein